ncbi:IucA/IucC family protein [Microbacterium sp. NPDC058342]|uniref:IucA/IucC family protein n=1 Tax=Microbacterium sp. NPDC058342 TaxID=3346454 RepID=UPI0036573580
MDDPMTGAPTASNEDRLVSRLLDAVLREDLWGWRTRGTVRPGARGAMLASPGGDLALPVQRGLTADWVTRAPELERRGAVVRGLHPVLDALEPLVDPQDRDGFSAWREECAAALRADDALSSRRERALRRIRGRSSADVHRRALVDESAAAHLGHPVYPTGSARTGLSEAEDDAYGPESLPSFPLRWFSVDRAALDGTIHEGALPNWWPVLDGDRFALPSHPLMADRLAEPALRPMPEAPPLLVTPTLSMRTVAVDRDPSWSLKVPVPTATLGTRNRRLVSLGSLRDGAAGEILLRRVLSADPAWRSRVLHADEQSFGGLRGRDDATVLLRRNPAQPSAARVVSVAALPATSLRTARPVICELAAHMDATVPALFGEVCTLIFDFSVWLYARGIALEAHQQNISLIAEPGHPLRLLLKDNDGLRVLPDRLRLPAGAERPAFDDGRIIVDSVEPLRHLVTTITVHLVAGMLAVALADAGIADRDTLLRIAAAAFEDAVDRVGGEAARELREGIIDSARWPVKAMVTAGTLLSKERSGALDVNKHYVDGPNYLFGAR